MQRYFVNNELQLGQIFQVDQDQLKHIYKVMRCNNGDHIICIDHMSHVYLCEIIDVSQGMVKPIEIRLDNHELDVDITLIYALPKSDKFEFVLQKTTELGVKRIVPLLSQRCVIKTSREKFLKKYDRYQRIVKEASEQSYRLCIPTIEQLIDIHGIKNYLSDINLVAYEEASKQGEASHFSQALESDYRTMTIVVGPEGGFDAQEIDYMKSLGIVECSLGKRILRSETAPIYMMSVIGYTRELK